MTNSTSQYYCKFGFRLQNESTLFLSTLSAVNCLTAFSAITLNSLVLLSMWKTTALRKPSHILIANLALADFLMGAIGQPLVVLKNIFIIFKKVGWFGEVCITATVGKTLTYWFGSVSAFTITVISIDRFLAIKMKISYANLVTLKRVSILLFIWWIFSGIFAFYVFFLSELDTKTLVSVFCVVMACGLSIITISYYKATKLMRKLLSEISPKGSKQDSVKSTFNVSKYQKSLKTMAIVLFIIVGFYAPYFITLVVSAATTSEGGDFLIYHVLVWTEALLLANSSINPVVYLWRMRDLREAAKSFLKSLMSKNNSALQLELTV